MNRLTQKQLKNLKTTLNLASLLILAAASSSSFASGASVKVIYGDDNRVDVNDVLNPLYLKLAKSTAAMIPSHKVLELNAEQVEIGGKSLADGGVCESERFAQQPTAANCSGFLVNKNQLVTAGHCIRSESDCKNNLWVFDYKVDHPSQGEVAVDKKSVYKCKKIISRSLDSATENDYALIELEKGVLDREPLKVRAEGKPQVGDQLVVIGHPSGLPTKVADGASVREVKDVYLKANLDTYGGNSGSAVFNSKTGVVEGILVRGERDYVWSSEQGCRVSNVLANTGGDGEDVTLISMVEGLVQEDEAPTEPTEPTEPVEPTEPTEPTEPEEPTQPEEPTDDDANDDGNDDSGDSDSDDDASNEDPHAGETWLQRLIRLLLGGR